MSKKFGEFRIGDICTQLRGKESSPNKVPDGNINMVNEISSNNGIAKKGFSNNVFKAPAITVSVNFARNVFVQEEDFCASVNILILKSKWIDNHLKAALYVASILSKNNKKYDYSHKISKDKLNDTIITLPLIDGTTDQIDWDYMDSYISELEQERISELDAYLKATGLDDYELTEEDKEILASAVNGGAKSQNQISGSCLGKWERKFKEFRLDELFDICGTKSLDAGSLIFEETGIRFVGRTNENNGCQGYIKRQAFEPNEPYTITATVIGNYKYTKFQEEPYYCSQNINKLVLKDIFNYQLNAETAQYLMTLIYKFVSQYNGQQGGYKLNQLKSFKIRLPVDSNNNPDFDYMERYIKAMEKVVIADVIKCKDNMISTTKSIVV